MDLSGPFQQWVHRHTFRSVSPAVTEVITIEITFADAWLWKAVGWGMYLNLPHPLPITGWQTKRLLEKANPPVGKPAHS